MNRYVVIERKNNNKRNCYKKRNCNGVNTFLLIFSKF